MAPSSSDLVLTLLLLLLVTSFDVEPYPLLHLPRRHSPSSIAVAQRLGHQDPGTWPLPDGAVKQANCWGTQLPHGLNRSDGVPEPDGSASGDGSTDDGGGAARDGVGEDGGVVAVHGASGPKGWPRGPMEMRAFWRIIGAPTRPVTTVMRWLSSSSSPSSSPLTAR
jgi:hypothetical protein